MSIDRRIRTSLLSIASDALLIGIKSALAAFTGSMALKADALHSASDLAISAIVLLSLGFRRWGERREAKSGSAAKSPEKSRALCRMEAALSYAIACLILYAPWEIASSLLSREVSEVRNLGIGIGGILACIALTGFMARLKLQGGKETSSAALTADGYHSGTDFFSSIAVLFAIMGDAIGIALDPIVACLIALLIGVTGIELFVASARAFILGESLRTDDLGDWINRGIRWLIRPPMRAEKMPGSESEAVSAVSQESPHRTAASGSTQTGSASRDSSRLPRLTPLRAALGLGSCLLLAWGISGLTAIGPDEVGVRVRFGRVTGEILSPGLHAALPFPFERVLRHRPALVRRVEVGFRTLPDGRENKLFDESISLAGDESVADLNLAVHFTVPDAQSALFRARSLDEMVRALAESAVREVMATQKADAVLSDGQGAFLKEVEHRLKDEISALHLGVSVSEVLLTAARPPSAVMPAFRDVFSAREDQLKELQQAEARRNDAIPKARAESASRVSEAVSFALDRRLRTSGDAERFLLQSEASSISYDLTAWRLFLETAETGLAGHKKIIAEPEANFGGYQLWLFGPSQPPAALQQP